MEGELRLTLQESPLISFDRIMLVKSNGQLTSSGLIDAVYQKRETLGLTSEQVRLVERLHMDFTRQGANFSDEEKKEYADLKAKLASLQTEFSQNVMKDEETYEIVLSKEDMDGCPRQ